MSDHYKIVFFNISNNKIIISSEYILGEKKIDKMASKFMNTLFEIIVSIIKGS